MNVEPRITQGLIIQPGDTLLIGVEGHLTKEAANRYKTLLCERLPGLADVILLNASSLAAYRPDGDTDCRHIIEFRADGWTIKHPLACRPNLFDCRVNRVAEVDLGAIDEPPAPPGRYECWLNDLGDRICIGDRIEVGG